MLIQFPTLRRLKLKMIFEIVQSFNHFVVGTRRPRCCRRAPSPQPLNLFASPLTVAEYLVATMVISVTGKRYERVTCVGMPGLHPDAAETQPRQ